MTEHTNPIHEAVKGAMFPEAARRKRPPQMSKDTTPKMRTMAAGEKREIKDRLKWAGDELTALRRALADQDAVRIDLHAYRVSDAMGDIMRALEKGAKG